MAAAHGPSEIARATRRRPSQATTSTSTDQARSATQPGTCTDSSAAKNEPCGNR